MNDMRNFWNDEEGMGTVEMVLLIAALVAIAIILGTQIKNFVTKNAAADTSAAEQGVDNLLNH